METTFWSRLRHSIVSPQTAVALLILCLAVGGTAYAAATITGKQIVNDTVTSADIKDKTLKSKDISKKAKEKLRGQDGAQGPQGVPGPSNAYVVRRTDGAAAAAPSSTVLVKRLVIPAGKFTVASKVNVSDTSGAPRLVECRLVNGTAVLDSTLVTVSGAAGGWTCPNMAAVDLTAAATTIELHVVTPAASAVALLPNAVMMATKVGSLASVATAGN
jgi:hypothetical protein